MNSNDALPTFSDPNQYPFINDPDRVINSITITKDNVQAKWESRSTPNDYPTMEDYLQYLYNVHKTADSLISEYLKEINNSMKGGNDLEGRNSLALRLRAQIVWKSESFRALIAMHSRIIREMRGMHNKGVYIDMSYTDENRNKVKSTIPDFVSYSDLKRAAYLYNTSVDTAYNRSLSESVDAAYNR